MFDIDKANRVLNEFETNYIIGSAAEILMFKLDIIEDEKYNYNKDIEGLTSYIKKAEKKLSDIKAAIDNLDKLKEDIKSTLTLIENLKAENKNL
jgi:prefoldin subunit 5